MKINEIMDTLEIIERKLLVISLGSKNEIRLEELLFIEEEIMNLSNIISKNLVEINSDLNINIFSDIIYKLNESKLQLLIYKNDIEGKSNKMLFIRLKSLWNNYNAINEISKS